VKHTQSDRKQGMGADWQGVREVSYILMWVAVTQVYVAIYEYLGL
jgi:hypothetical protein